MLPSIEDYKEAIRNILGNWEHGDLAGAVNAARELVEYERRHTDEDECKEGYTCPHCAGLGGAHYRDCQEV